MSTTPPRKPAPRRLLPWPSPVTTLLIGTVPTIISVAVWYRIEPMGRLELAASSALGVFVSLLIWGLVQVRRDRQRHAQNTPEST